jgi:hypothetical protein
MKKIYRIVGEEEPGGDSELFVYNTIRAYLENTGRDTFITSEILALIQFSGERMSTTNFFKVFNKLKKKKIVEIVY